MTHMNPPWHPQMDAEAAAFGDRLRREKYPDGINARGWIRWGSDWRMHRANGIAPDSAFELVAHAIDMNRSGLEPPPAPGGSFSVPWLPAWDYDGEIFYHLLNGLYHKEHPSGTPTPVDALGYVRWSSDYRIHRANGASHESAWKRVATDIRRIWGIGPPKQDAAIVGQFGCDDLGFFDASGRRVVSSCHAGDLIGQALKSGLAHVLPALDDIAGAGYQILRSWVNQSAGPGMRPYDLFWKTKPAPMWNLLDNRQLSMEVIAAAYDRGLRWHLASGGLMGLSNRQEDELFDFIGDVMAEVGPESIALLECANEARDTSDDDDREPAELDRLIQRVRARFPNALCSLTAYTGHEDIEIHRRYTPAWQRFLQQHDYRGGRVNDKVRHLFSGPYDGEQKPVRRVIWRGEPFGVGREEGPFRLLVSAQDGGHELLDSGVMPLAAVMGSLRGLWTFFCDPGVILYDEPFTSVPGFAETPAIVNQLPQDLHTFQTLNHGGDSRRGLRIHAAVGDWRADYAIDPATGRYVEVVYGPPEQRERPRQERATRDVERLVDGPWGYVEIGRIA